MKAKTECWMAQGPTGYLLVASAARIRIESIRFVLDHYPDGTRWKSVYREGWRVLRVVVREI